MRMVHILTSVVVSYQIIGEKLPWEWNNFRKL